MREVAEGVAAEFEVIALAAVHRTGHLEIGDIAVLVAASAPHRGQAYDASRALIDRLKATVPSGSTRSSTTAARSGSTPRSRGRYT